MFRHFSDTFLAMEVSPLRPITHVPKPGLHRPLARSYKVPSWRPALAALAAAPRVARRGREKVLDMAQLDGRLQEMQSTFQAAKHSFSFQFKSFPSLQISSTYKF